MKILHIAESALGGVGSYLSYLAPLQRAAVGDGAVRIILPRQHSAQLNGFPEKHIAPFDRPGRGVASVTAMAAILAAEVRDFRPDVIHAHSTFAGLAVRLLYRMRRNRPALIYCPHGWSFNIRTHRWKSALLERAEKGLSDWCDAIVAISRYEAAEGVRIGIDPRRLHLVLNGVPDHQPAPDQASWDDPRLKVLFVGRLDRQKGFDTLIEAVGSSADRICVRAAGAAVVVDASTPQPPCNVELLGWLTPPQVAAQMRASDVVVVPSRWEGFGLVAIEAMRAARPVVASRVGGLPEVVEDGITGRLIAPDAPDELRRTLLGDGAAQHRAMGQRGRARYLDRFTAQRMCDEMLVLYGRCAQGRRGRGTARPDLAA